MKCPTCKTILAEFNVKPGVRIIVTMPSTASPEMVENAQKALVDHFPDNPIFVHTDEITVTPEDEK